MNKKRGGCPVLVTRNSLLVTRISPFAKASGDKPTPRRAGRDTPRPGSTHANYVCAGPGGGGHWRVPVTGGGQEVFDFLFGGVIIFRALDDYQCGV